MQISISQCHFLHLLIKSSKIKKILEIGTFTGLSALSMALALPEDGSVIALDKNTKTNLVIKERRIIGDVVSINKGKVTFEELGSSKVISDKYRKKVEFLQIGEEEILVQGELDLDTKSTDPVKIILKPDQNNKQKYIGIGVFYDDKQKHKSENIKIILEPAN